MSMGVVLHIRSSADVSTFCCKIDICVRASHAYLRVCMTCVFGRTCASEIDQDANVRFSVCMYMRVCVCV